MTETVEVVERGCGWPQEGGLYFFIGLSAYGIPAEDFLLDPLIPIPKELKVRPRGLTLVEIDGVWHIVDHVGSVPYPNATDWFEELKRYGFHQRVETTLDFTKLDWAKSRYLVTHARVIPSEPELWQFYQALGVDERTCIHGLDNHNDYWMLPPQEPNECPVCASLLWTDLIKGERTDESENGHAIYTVVRQMPSFSYLGTSFDFPTSWEPGFFASFPLSMMKKLIYTGKDGEHEDSAATAVEHGLNEEDIQFVELT